MSGRAGVEKLKVKEELYKNIFCITGYRGTNCAAGGCAAFESAGRAAGADYGRTQ